MSISVLATRLANDSGRFFVRADLRSFAPKFLSGLLGAFFPHFRAHRAYSSGELESAIEIIGEELYQELVLLDIPKPRPLVEAFIGSLGLVYDMLLSDAEAIVRGDPAATGLDEVVLCYPGFFAISAYRIAHELWELKVPLLPRVITEYAHRETGIDIHPGATIGKGFCIDHGTGIVIGETTIIKDNVRMYQGVTLGGLVITKDQANKKRHPTIEDNVVIYANATILGGDTVIGAGSVIGGCVWITSSIEPSSMVYHKSDVTVRSTAKKPE